MILLTGRPENTATPISSRLNSPAAAGSALVGLDGIVELLGLEGVEASVQALVVESEREGGGMFFEEGR